MQNSDNVHILHHDIQAWVLQKYALHFPDVSDSDGRDPGRDQIGSRVRAGPYETLQAKAHRQTLMI